MAEVALPPKEDPLSVIADGVADSQASICTPAITVGAGSTVTVALVLLVHPPALGEVV